MSSTYRRIGGTDLQLHSFVTSALDGVEWLTFRPGRFNLGTEHRCPLNRKLGGPQSRPGDFGEKSRTYTGIRTPDRPTYSLVAIPTALLRLHLNVMHNHISYASTSSVQHKS